MVNIKALQQDIQYVQPIENTVDSKLEFYKNISEVQSGIKNEITTDFTFCKLDDHDKEAVIEMVNDSYYAKQIILSINERATKWEWDKDKWVQRHLNNEETAFIKIKANRIFDVIMTRIFMIAILNRNVKDNHLIRTLTNTTEIEEPQEEERKGFLKRLLSKERKEEEIQKK